MALQQLSADRNWYSRAKLQSRELQKNRTAQAIAGALSGVRQDIQQKAYSERSEIK